MKATAKLSISIMIPAHNEEKSIHRSIESALGQIRQPDQIVVVNDGSTDKTLEIIESYGERITVIDIPRATGNKSYAQEKGLPFITGDIMVTGDADTLFDPSFLLEVEQSFLNDPRLAAVAGMVTSLKHNWLTACRQIDYSIGQNLHKLAQSYIGYVMVIPGCAAAFRTDIFREHITFDHDTITEDMDFTYKLHHQGFKVAFNRHAVVYTQDPSDLRSYILQMRRWYRGGWQNLRKHLAVAGKPSAALELSLSYIEGLFMPLLFVILLFVNIYSAGVFLLMYFLSSVALGLYAALSTRRLGLFFTAPQYFYLQLINNWIFLQELFWEIKQKNQQLVWISPKRREIV